MSAISRATIPQEFLDLTSATLLIQPKPQFFHAGLVMNALRVNTDFSGQWGLPIAGRQFGDGGLPDYAALKDQLTKLVDADAVYGSAIRVVSELGKKGVGHTLRINRPKFTEGTATRAARRVPVGTSFAKTPIPVLSEQAQITIERFAGPYDTTAGEVRPYGIERFDAERMLHNPASLKDLHLDYDFHRSLDTWAVSLFDQGEVIYPTGMTADNDSLVAESFPFSYELLTRAEESLSNANIPRFANGRYMAVVTPKQARQLKLDPMFQRLAVYHTDINPLFKRSYRGTVGMIDVFESTTLSQVLNSSSVPIQYGQVFGPESVGWGVDDMPRVAPDSDDNFGETAKVIWIWYCGFDVLDSRFQRSVRSD